MAQDEQMIQRIYGESSEDFQKTARKGIPVLGVYIIITILAIIYLNTRSYRSFAALKAARSLNSIFMFFIVLEITVFVLFIIAFLVVGRVKKAYIEITANGVTVVPAFGQSVSIPFEQIKTPRYENGNVVIESIYNVKGFISVKNPQCASEICSQIQSIIDEHK